MIIVIVILIVIAIISKQQKHDTSDKKVKKLRITNNSTENGKQVNITRQEYLEVAPPPAHPPTLTEAVAFPSCQGAL